MKTTYRAAAAAAAIAVVSFGAAGVAAADDRELIVRQSIGFDDCAAKIESYLDHVNADRDNVFVTRDTGAHYRLKLVSERSNLIFFCNAVSERIEISRTWPGELHAAAE